MLKSTCARQVGGPSTIFKGMPMNLAHAGRGLVVMATLALCALVPLVARAESEVEKKQRAKDHYEKATRLYDVGKYGEAISEYEEAYLLIEDAALLFNIGQAYRLWDHLDEAIRAYKNYLRRRPDATNRADVEKKIADLEKVAEERRRGGGAQPPAPLPGPVSPPPAGPPMAPGPGGQAPGTATDPPLGPVDVAAPPPVAPPKSRRSWLTYSILGVSGACLLTATAAGVVAASKAKKVQDASKNGEPFDPAVESNGKTANMVALISGVAGLAMGGLGAYLWWSDRKASRTAVTIVPEVAPSYAGGSVALSF
jgi:tetratricopeptide (TPR) repeat protein